MYRNEKIFVMFIMIALGSLIFFAPKNVHAQPLGIMSQAQPPPQNKVLSSGAGRFVFGQISGSSKDKFMLDTVSGRLWRISESGEVGMFLSEVPYRTEDGEYSPLPANMSGPIPKKNRKK
jgi:hypothetical protein